MKALLGTTTSGLVDPISVCSGAEIESEPAEGVDVVIKDRGEDLGRGSNA